MLTKKEITLTSDLEVTGLHKFFSDMLETIREKLKKAVTAEGLRIGKQVEDYLLAFRDTPPTSLSEAHYQEHAIATSALLLELDKKNIVCNDTVYRIKGRRNTYLARDQDGNLTYEDNIQQALSFMVLADPENVGEISLKVADTPCDYLSLKLDDEYTLQEEIVLGKEKKPWKLLLSKVNEGKYSYSLLSGAYTFSKYDATKTCAMKNPTRNDFVFEPLSPSWLDYLSLLESRFPSLNRLLSKPTAESKMRGESERRTGVYTSVYEDSSTESTRQFTAAVGFGQKSNFPILAQIRLDEGLTRSQGLNVWDSYKCSSDEQSMMLLFETFLPKLTLDREQSPIYIIGNTGAGKSTITNGLIGRQFRTHNSQLQVSDGDQPNAEMGHNCCSKTIFPMSFQHGKHIYWDCPGFGDTRQSAKTLTMFASALVQKCSADAKAMIIVIDPSEIIGERGRAFKDLLKILKNLINHDFLKQKTFFILNMKGKKNDDSFYSLLNELRKEEEEKSRRLPTYVSEFQKAELSATSSYSDLYNSYFTEFNMLFSDELTEKAAKDSLLSGDVQPFHIAAKLREFNLEIFSLLENPEKTFLLADIFEDTWAVKVRNALDSLPSYTTSHDVTFEKLIPEMELVLFQYTIAGWVQPYQQFLEARVEDSKCIDSGIENKTLISENEAFIASIYRGLIKIYPLLDPDIRGYFDKFLQLCSEVYQLDSLKETHPPSVTNFKQSKVTLFKEPIVNAIRARSIPQHDTSSP